MANELRHMPTDEEIMRKYEENMRAQSAADKKQRRNNNMQTGDSHVHLHSNESAPQFEEKGTDLKVLNDYESTETNQQGYKV